MTEEDIDFDSFRKSRWQGLREWWQIQTHQLLFWGHDVGGRFSQKGWIQTKARVISCTPVRRSRFYFPRRYPPLAPSFGGWIVEFTYSVDGKTYDGVTNSPSEVQKDDTFAVRFNPSSPGENNSLDSELSWVRGPIVAVYELFLAVLLLAFLAIDILHR